MRRSLQTTPIEKNVSPRLLPRATRRRTKPVMQLLDPARPCILHRRIQEDNLVLYPNLMHDRLQHHMMLQELFVLRLLIPSSLIWEIPEGPSNVPPRVPVIRPVELSTPHLDDSSKALEEDALYPLVKLSDPVLQVGVTFEVELVDSGLDLVEEVGEGFAGVWTSGEVFNVSENIFVEVDNIIGLVLLTHGWSDRRTRKGGSTYLKNGNNTGKFADELYMPVVPPI